MSSITAVFVCFVIPLGILAYSFVREARKTIKRRNELRAELSAFEEKIMDFYRKKGMNSEKAN